MALPVVVGYLSEAHEFVTCLVRQGRGPGLDMASLWVRFRVEGFEKLSEWIDSGKNAGGYATFESEYPLEKNEEFDEDFYSIEEEAFGYGVSHYGVFLAHADDHDSWEEYFED